MRIPYFQVSAFAASVHGGNPAGVCLLHEWPADELLQRLARENDLSETAYLVPEEGRHRLRWFTPESEVDLCGHATLASAYVLFDQLYWPTEQVEFLTRSGILRVRRNGGGFTMRFPSDSSEVLADDPGLENALGARPSEIRQGKFDLMAVYESEEQVRDLNPDYAAVGGVETRGVIATAPGKGDFDFVSRFFAPRFGIDEDPVTGSAHCTLASFWSERLGKTTLSAWQASARGGAVQCEVLGDAVELTGEARLYLRGELVAED